MYSNDQSYLDDFFISLTPPPDLPITEWCEKNINLLEKSGCPEPGPLRLSRTPYCKGPLNAFTSLYIEQIDLVWGRQTAKSTTVYHCPIYSLVNDPGPTLFLFPNQTLGKFTSKNRIQTHIEGCKAAKDKISPNPDDYTIFEMGFVDMVISIGWAGSSTQVMSRPVRYLYIDEIDEMPKAVGEGVSSPVKSALETTSNFGNRKIFKTSTPSDEFNYMWQDIKTCQLVFEYWVPCPHCGTMQILVWDQIKWPKEEKDLIKISSLAWYECKDCQAHIYDRDKPKMLEGGEWRARICSDAAGAILRSEEVVIENTILLEDIFSDSTIKHIGFHLPQWYSPFPNATFGNIVKDFLDAQGDFQKMRDWTKFKRALPWVEKAATPKYHELLQNKIDLPPTVCPRDTIALTCTLDPGQGGLWYTVLAWQQNTNRHLVEYGFLPTWDQVAIKCFQSSYEVDGIPGARLPIWRVGIDTGGSKYEDEDLTFTEQAYMWLRRVQRNNVFGIKGDSAPRSGSRMRISIIDKMPGAKGQIIPGGLALYLVDTSSFKDAVHYHLQVKPDDPGRLTFHDQVGKTGEDLIGHILAESKRRNKKGQWEWMREKPRNDLFACLAYGFAMADPECMGGVRVLRAPVWNKPKPKETEEKNGGWLDGIDRLKM